MATTLGTIRTRLRTNLIEGTASFWSDAELLEHLVAGVKDLWGAIVDLHQEHYFTVDESNVSLAANTATLTGTPADLFRVLKIEPRTLTSGTTGRTVTFRRKDYNHDDFRAARMMDNQDPSGDLIIWYAVTKVGAPFAAPTIYVAPKLTSALNLRLIYIPTLADTDLEAGDNTPVPGEADNALFCWGMAWARSKEREDSSPDPNWLALYATEKQNLMTRNTPRDESEPEVVEGMFEGY